LLEFLNTLDIEDRQLLELGAGSGLISIYCSKKKNAKVTASDISSVAIRNIEKNAKLNNTEIRIVQSDLFDNLDGSNFDFIIINPPFYPKNPASESENAWYCGEDFQYFRKLFLQMNQQVKMSTVGYMIVSEDCQISKIRDIAQQHSFQLILKIEKMIWGEKNFIYEITKK
jgi:release factor glutamine methyltransferase